MPEGWTSDGLVVSDWGSEMWAVAEEGSVAQAACAAARRDEAVWLEALLRLAASWGLAEGFEEAGKRAVGTTDDDEEAMAFGRFGDAPPAQLASSPATDPPVEVVKNAARPANACFVFFRPSAALSESSSVERREDEDPRGGGARTSENWRGAEAGMGWRRLRGGELEFEWMDCWEEEEAEEEEEGGSESRSIESTSSGRPEAWVMGEGRMTTWTSSYWRAHKAGEEAGQEELRRDRLQRRAKQPRKHESLA
jgi:hypothetical protein